MIIEMIKGMMRKKGKKGEMSIETLIGLIIILIVLGIAIWIFVILKSKGISLTDYIGEVLG